MIEIVPAILPSSYSEIEEALVRMKGLVSRVQIDIANGSYAPTKTWPYTSADHFKELVDQSEGLPMWEDFEYEIDMLIKNPEEVIDDWIATGIAAAIIHIESTEKLPEIHAKLSAAGVACGLGIKPSTSLEKLFENIQYADFVQCMGNDNIGHHGVELDDRVYERIAEIRERYPELPIAVDIGVDEETASELIDAGATKLVSGSVLFDAPGLEEEIAILKGE